MSEIIRTMEERTAVEIAKIEKNRYVEQKKREASEAELRSVKALMEEQMAKAEEICAQVEARYRALPNPFEDEVHEVRERVEQQ